MKRTILAILLFTLCHSGVLCAQPNRYLIVFLDPNPDAKHSKEQAEQIMKGHNAARGQLAKEGKLVAAGPFEGGGGIYVLNTSSEDEAREWLRPDPGIEQQHWRIEIYPYQPRHGGICPVGEKYTMTNYSFVRFDVIVSKTTAHDYPLLLREHDRHIKSIIEAGNVITEAIFGERDGGILIMKGDIDRAVIESDPAVQQGLIQFQIKKFYTAKGVFCEE